MERVRRSRALRRIAGVAWFLVWTAALYTVAAPWTQLGGLVSDRLRWMEWAVLCAALTVGFTVGRFAGRFAAERGAFPYLRMARFLLYPAGVVTALVLVYLAWRDRDPQVGVVATAFLAYWAGLDLAFGAVPLLDGRCPGRAEDPA